MQQNILKNSDITKIYIVYLDAGLKKKMNVKLRYMDDKKAYFVGDVPVNFSKPKGKPATEVSVYTSDGIYKSNVTLLSVNYSMREIVYEISLPKSWNYIQLRTGSRKDVNLPVYLKFNDEFELTATTENLSIGGVAFYSKQQISSIYKKISGKLTLQLPTSLILNFPEGKFNTDVKYIRESHGEGDHCDETLYVFKFLNVSANDSIILKNYLMALE